MSRLLCNKCLSNYLFKTNIKSSINKIIDRNFSFESYANSMIKMNRSIADSSVLRSTKEYLIAIHEWLPISWSLEIALITTAVRTVVTFPLIIRSQKILKRYENLEPEIKQFAERSLQDVRTLGYLYNWSAFKTKLYHQKLMNKEMKRLIIRDNCHPIKASLVVWFQLPFWLTLSISIRHMAFMFPTVDQTSQLVYSQLSNEGILWFQDLTQTDPYCVLPILVAIINLTIIQIHSNERLLSGKRTRLQSIITNTCRAVCLILIPIGMQMPSAVCFYWLVSSSVGLSHNLILRNKRVKHYFGIDLKKVTTNSTQKTQ